MPRSRGTQTLYQKTAHGGAVRFVFLSVGASPFLRLHPVRNTYPPFLTIQFRNRFAARLFLTQRRRDAEYAEIFGVDFSRVERVDRAEKKRASQQQRANRRFTSAGSQLILPSSMPMLLCLNSTVYLTCRNPLANLPSPHPPRVA